MNERKEKVTREPLTHQIEKILDDEGPCSLTKITRLVNEGFQNGSIARSQVSASIDKMMRNKIISPCFYPGNPPEELKKADVYYGYFLTRNTMELIDAGIIGESTVYDINDIARGEGLRVPYTLEDLAAELRRR